MQEIQSYHVPMLAELAEKGVASPREMEAFLAAVEDLKIHVDTSYKRPEGQYSKVRKMLSAAIKDEQILKLIRTKVKMTKDQYDLANRASAKMVEARNEKQTVFSFEFVTSVVEKVRPCVSFADKFTFLQLACGARKIELLDEGTSEFFAIPDQRRLIHQVGFAKKGPTPETKEITKPLLWIDSWNFLEILQELRDEVRKRGKGSRDVIAKSFSTQLEKLSKFLYPQNVANGHRTGTHLNRAIYANTAYRFRKAPGQSLTKFIKHQLGHDSMGSAANYMNIAIAFAADTPMLGEAALQQKDMDTHGCFFDTPSGQPVFMPYAPIRRLSEEQRKKELQGFVDALTLHNIAITRGNLMKLGFQSSLIKASGVLLRE